MDTENTNDDKAMPPASAGYAVKWKTQRGFLTIERVEVVRETAKFLWAKDNWFKYERQLAKESDYHKFHDSWDDAKVWMLIQEAQAIEVAEASRKKAEQRIREIEAMERPA